MHTSVPSALAAVAASLALAACSTPLDPPSAEAGGSGGGGRPAWAPPISQPVPDPVGRYPRPNLDHGCAEGETLNGFPCQSVPGTGGVVYPSY